MRGIPWTRTAGVVALAAVAAVVRLAAADPPVEQATSDTSAVPATVPAEVPPDLHVRVVVADFGEIVIRLDRERVPNAASLFLTLAGSGAFDGVTFHRVIPGLLVQTGDPATRDEDPANDGTSAPPWQLPAEAAVGEHRRGTVSFAWRGNDPASAGTQWFVTLADVPALNGHATPIGEVIGGMDVVDRIAQVSTLRDRRPLRPVRIASAKPEPATTPTAPTPAPAVESTAK